MCCEVTKTFNFVQQILISSSLTCSGSLSQNEMNSLKAFLRLCVHKIGTHLDRHPENITPRLSQEQQNITLGNTRHYFMALLGHLLTKICKL